MAALLLVVVAIAGFFLVNQNGSSVGSAATAQVQSGLSANMQAFLALIRQSEGTAGYSDPYGVIEGGATFTDKSCHPFEAYNGRAPLFTIGVPPAGTTSASGAYQIIVGTWNQFGGTAGFGDFSDSAQDACAVAIITNYGAAAQVEAGDITGAQATLGSQWASFTAANLANNNAAFTAAGGTLTA